MRGVRLGHLQLFQTDFCQVLEAASALGFLKILKNKDLYLSHAIITVSIQLRLLIISQKLQDLIRTAMLLKILTLIPIMPGYIALPNILSSKQGNHNCDKSLV